MTRFAMLGFGLLLLAGGAVNVWLHVQSGAVLTLEGCQGGTFTVALGARGGHCWGCYIAALGALFGVAAMAAPPQMLERRPNLRKTMVPSS